MSAHLGSKGLVELEDINVVDGEAGLLHGGGDCNSRANAHDGRVHADGRERAEDAQHRQTALGRLAPLHQQHRRSTVTDLQVTNKENSQHMLHELMHSDVFGTVSNLTWRVARP